MRFISIALHDGFFCKRAVYLLGLHGYKHYAIMFKALGPVLAKEYTVANLELIVALRHVPHPANARRALVFWWGNEKITAFTHCDQFWFDQYVVAYNFKTHGLFPPLKKLIIFCRMRA
jgi:hypothetical protein